MLSVGEDGKFASPGRRGFDMAPCFLPSWLSDSVSPEQRYVAEVTDPALVAP